MEPTSHRVSPRRSRQQSAGKATSIKSGRSYDTEPINADLQEHVRAASDWSYQTAANTLHLWADRFNLEFKLGLPTPVIRIDRLSRCHLGSYRHGRNGFGLTHEISMNVTHLGAPLSEQLATLLHEQIHAWQYLFGKAGRRNYHNVAFRWKAALYGLQINERGQHLGVRPGPFTELLEANSVDLSELRLASPDNSIFPVRARGDSKLKKYSCPCGINVRCAVNLLAQCLRCGGQFQEAPPAW